MRRMSFQRRGNRGCRAIPLTAAGIMLCGCATPGPGAEGEPTVIVQAAPSPSPAVERKADGGEADAGVSALLRYARAVRAQPEPLKRRELRRAEQTLVGEPGPEERLRLGLLLLLPDTGFRDVSQARRLLQQVAKDGASEEQRGLSEILLVLLNENVAEEQARRRIAERWQDEKQQREILHRQLEALKAIEKTLIERTRPDGLRLDDQLNDVEPTENPAGRR